ATAPPPRRARRRPPRPPRRPAGAARQLRLAALHLRRRGRKRAAGRGADRGAVGCPDPLAARPRSAGGRARSLVLYGGLAQAVKRESAEAEAHHWGVTAQTVTIWRKALDV